MTFTIDRTGPVTTVDPVESPTADRRPDVTFSADDEGATFECRVDDGDWVECSSPFEPASDLSDGEHTISVRATDAVGNTGEPDSTTFVVDASPPDTTITSGPSGTLYNDPAVFHFESSEPNSTFECRLDGGEWLPCESPKTYPAAGLTQGGHTFAVRATDALGNTDPTPATRSFTFRRCTILKTVINLFGQPITICL